MHFPAGFDSRRLSSSSHGSCSHPIPTSRNDGSLRIPPSSPRLVPSAGHSFGSYSTGGLSSSYRRQTVISGSYGLPSVLSTSPSVSVFCLTRSELEDLEDDERKLLKDNNIITTSYGSIRPESRASNLSLDDQKSLLPQERLAPGAGADSGEAARLIGNEDIASKWEDAVTAGKIHTTWQRESKVLARYAVPLVVTFTLQYSLTIASILSAGNLGKNELAAVSLAGMTGSITGYAVFQGLATSLDTLCAQAYGAGQKKLVGLHMQRMVFFLFTMWIPIACVWYSAENILRLIVPDKQLAALAGSYLRILMFGLPGYAMFESGKRFTQAQGLFSASTWVLIITSPINAFLNWALVWHPTIGIGFRGAPIAVVITNYLMPFLLFLYVRFIAGSECWGGFSRKALQNWGPMVRLAIPGLLMLLAEFLAFEILTLLASYFSTAHVAAQSVIATTCSFFYQIPFALSIACSTRVANFLGATLADAAKQTAYTGLIASALQGCINFTILYCSKHAIPRLFTSDPEVIGLVAHVLPLAASFQFVDGIAAMGAGILRGQGRQYIGGWVNLVAYYIVALPLSIIAGFLWHWELLGLWTGISMALMLVAGTESYVILKTNWEQVVEAALQRNAAA